MLRGNPRAGEISLGLRRKRFTIDYFLAQFPSVTRTQVIALLESVREKAEVSPRHLRRQKASLHSLKIILLSIVAACMYGVVHDQITARICVEYFTIGHPPVFGTDSPTLLGFGWGIIASWWAGAMMGLPLAIAARAGSRPKISAPGLVRPIGFLLLIMAAVAAIAGVVSYILARSRTTYLVDPMASEIAHDRQPLFLADAGTHLASYAVGVIGGLVLCLLTWRRRGASVLARPISSEGLARP